MALRSRRVRRDTRGLDVYRPPFGVLGAGLDRLVLRRVAEATIREFTQSIRTG